jgi:hypothetical protein
MRTTTMTLMLTMLPTLLAAQSADQADPMQGLSAQGRVQAEATIQAAVDQGLPDQPLYAVMLEGQAKGATEAQILTAEQQMLAGLELAQETIVRAGHSTPSADEVIQGASLLAQGTTTAELGAAVTQAPVSQSLATTLQGLVQAGAGLDATAGPVSGSTAASVSTATNVSTAAAVESAGGSASVTGSATAAVTAGPLGR